MNFTPRLSGLTLLGVAEESSYIEETKKRINCPGVTPLHRACQLGMESVVKLLLKAGANVNAMTEDLETPLYYAAKYSSTIGVGEVTGLLK
jgi:ankyrin repeat protein